MAALLAAWLVVPAWERWYSTDQGFPVRREIVLPAPMKPNRAGDDGFELSSSEPEPPAKTPALEAKLRKSPVGCTLMRRHFGFDAGKP